jgi:iron complex transport system substrate-binding protein
MLRLLTLLLAAGTLTLAACGGDEPATTTSAQTDETGASGFPVTVEQKLGAVTIDKPPTRIVALDYPSADAAIALGVTPVGMYEVSYVEGGVQEWTKAALTGEQPSLINTDEGFPFERIAALRPDVIVATNTYPLIADSWDKLNAIAPVVGHVGAPGQDTWQQGVRQIGKALGRTRQAEQLIAQTEAEVEQTREDHPEFAGKSLSFFNYVPGDGLYVIDKDSDASMKFLIDLGFAGVPDSIGRLEGTDGIKSVDGRAKISPERYDVIDADVILGTSPDGNALAELEQDRLFSQVPAVARGSFVGFGIGPATAMAFPSVLGVRYALDELAPRLAEAVATTDGRRVSRPARSGTGRACRGRAAPSPGRRPSA